VLKWNNEDRQTAKFRKHWAKAPSNDGFRVFYQVQELSISRFEGAPSEGRALEPFRRALRPLGESSDPLEGLLGP